LNVPATVKAIFIVADVERMLDELPCKYHFIVAPFGVTIAVRTNGLFWQMVVSLPALTEHCAFVCKADNSVKNKNTDGFKQLSIFFFIIKLLSIQQ
jgi:hypothetical protein